MADNDVTIGVREEGAPETADRIGKVSDAVKDLGATAEVQADKTEQAADAVEQYVGAATSAADGARRFNDVLERQITEITTSSDSLAVQRSRLEGIKDSLLEARGEYETFGKSGEDAVKGLDASLARLDTALDSLRTDSETALTPLERAMQNAEAAVARFEARLTSGAAVSKKDIDNIIRQQELLNREIELTGKTLDDLGPKAVSRYKQIDDAAERATVIIRRTSDAVGDHAKSLDEAGTQYRGLMEAIQDTSGAWGAAIGQIGLMTAAFTGGLAIGKQFADMLGTETQALEAFQAEIQKNGRSFQRDLVDVITDGTQKISLSFRDLIGTAPQLTERVKDMEEKIRAVHRASVDLRSSFNLNELEMRGFSVAVQAGVRTVDALRLSKEQLTKIAHSAELATRGGAEGQKAFAKAIDDSKGSSDKLIANLDKANPTLEKHAEAVKKAQLAYLEMDKQLERMLARQPELAAAYEQSAKLANEQEQAHNGITRSMQQELAQIALFLSQGPQRTDQVNIWVKALQDTTAKQMDLTNEERAHIAAIIEKIQKLTEATEATTKYTDEQWLAQEAVAGLTEAYDIQNRSIDVTQGQLSAAEENVKKLTEAYGADSQITRQAVEQRDSLARSLEFEKQKLEETKNELNAAKEAQTSVNDESARMSEALEAVGGQTTATNAQFQAMAEEIRKLVAGYSETATKVGDTGKKLVDLEDPLKKAGTAAGETKNALRGMGDVEFDKVIDRIRLMNQELENGRTKAEQLKVAISSIGEDEEDIDPTEGGEGTGERLS